MKKILRIAIYARVSTDEQKKFGFSISAQLDKLRKWCEENGYILVAEFVDEGYTASNMKRPDLQAMLSRLNEFDVIAFTRLDRFSRNVLEANKMLALLNKHKVGLISIEEDDIDTTTADGLFMFQLKVSLAEREIRKTSERIKSVFEFKIKEGQPITGNLPFGYKIASINGKKAIVKDEDTSPIVMTIFEHFNRYHSVRKTMFFVNEIFNLDRSYDSYMQVMKNKFYAGSYKGNDNYCPPYISIEQFEINRALIQKRNRVRKTDNVFLFSSLMKCPVCGKSIVGFCPISKGKKYYYYRCNSVSGGHACGFKNIHEKVELESFLINNIDRLVRDYIISVEDVKPIKRDNSKQRMKEIKEEMDVLNYQSQKRRITIEQYDQEFERLENELAMLQRNTSKEIDTSHLKEFLNSDWKDIYDSLSRENKRALWQNIIKEIVIDKDRNITVKFF